MPRGGRRGRPARQTWVSIRDLPLAKELDAQALAEVCGGNSWLTGLGPVANVNVGVNQNIVQVQNIEVNALNNVGIIGAGFGPLSLNVSPSQFALADVAF